VKGQIEIGNKIITLKERVKYCRDTSIDRLYHDIRVYYPLLSGGINGDKGLIRERLLLLVYRFDPSLMQNLFAFHADI